MTQDIISTLNEAHEETRKHACGFKSAVRQKLCKFRKDEDGSLIIFALYIFVIMLVVGGIAVDVMRSEYQRTKIQYTTDRALLAAASLKQTVPAQEVFDDYFAKSGMAGMAPVATVDASLNYRKVSAAYPEGQTPKIDTIFMSNAFRTLLHRENAGGVDQLMTSAAGTAEDGVEKIEISLVLDVSGSMRWSSKSGQAKIDDLKDAAKEFVDTLLLNQPEDDTYSISIVPYSTQVTAGETLLSHYNVSSEHNSSNCVDFTAASFDSTTVSPLIELQRTGHFAPTTYSDYRPPSDLRRACFADYRSNWPYAPRMILPLSGDNDALKDYIDGLNAAGWTSTEIGIKWGAALLDPSAQSVVTGLIEDSDVDAKFAGRPFNYTEDNILKVIVVMTDGANTNQYLLNDSVKDGMSPVWLETQTNGNNKYWVRNEDRSGDQYRRLFYYEDSDDRFRSIRWRASPESDATQLSWQELWAHAPMKFVSDELFYYAGLDSSWTSGSNGWPGFYSRVSGAAKDTRMSNICTAVKSNNTLIFTIGFEVSDSNATKLSACATSAGHFYRVEGVEISEAFASIAAQLNSLRLTH
ncbi:MAG: hypothetical protein COB39_08905 [Marinosulfonomonas sp.]|nr:MAG: hypothetical protein COB39_08905 [Marinosulfonomonas sp.]